MIKIISGYTGKGGSTTAFINLTNELNDRGHETILYGNQDWHLDKCKSGLLKDLSFDKEDRLITHFIDLQTRPDVKKVVLSCHEKWWFSFKNIKKYFDEAIFLHQEHRNFHKDYKGEFRIIPNLKEQLKPKEKPELNKVAGIIGSIEDRKKTHLSIIRALKDNCDKIILFGAIGDQNYYDTMVKPLLSDKIIFGGFTTNKQEMYDSIGRVYHSSIGEVACLVKDECYLTNTQFFGNEETNNEVSKLTNDEIIDMWLDALVLTK